jgi:hypothetical protein
MMGKTLKEIGAPLGQEAKQIEFHPGRHIPVPLDDLQKRLDMLRHAGVREYHDGDLHLVLAVDRAPQAHTFSAAQGTLCDRGR